MEVHWPHGGAVGERAAITSSTWSTHRGGYTRQATQFSQVEPLKGLIAPNEEVTVQAKPLVVDVEL